MDVVIDIGIDIAALLAPLRGRLTDSEGNQLMDNNNNIIQTR